MAGAIALAALAYATGRWADGGDGEAPAPIRVATATVERTDLVRHEEVEGTLSYGDAEPLANNRTGILTWLPPEGSIVELGRALYRVDEHPVLLLRGEVAAYRPLGTGAPAGPDIRQLEETLRDLGHFTATPDDSFTSATADAVARWQRALEIEATGRLELGSYAFAAGPVRVADHRVPLGSAVSPATPVLAVTGARLLVMVDLDPGDLDLVALGDHVEVELPDGAAAGAKVTAISDVASVAVSPTGAESDPTVRVTLRLDKRVAGARDQAPVTVQLVAERATDVLVVPVRALLALAEGGYAVEVDARPATRLVAVELGAFAGSDVEVRGELRPGDKVVIPAR